MISKKKVIKYSTLIVIAGGVLLETIYIGRIFFFVSCIIPTNSMQPTLLPGDYAYVSRLKSGKKKINHNDIILFDFPYRANLSEESDVYYIKRCVALPKDTFLIKNGRYMIKGLSISLGVIEKQEEFAKELIENDDTRMSFPYNTDLRWNFLNFGPFYIPSAGDTLPLTKENYALYRKCVEYETNSDLIMVGSKFFLDDKELTDYIFKENYYFVAGDFASGSEDSRYWGLLPESSIIGKALFIWKSKNPETGKYRFDRFFNVIK